uniref:Rhodanese domain-containing protein n=1 Tax=viral metagenome TaxID=1070528 RepID=A0A6C0D2C4_9ZZZZ
MFKKRKSRYYIQIQLKSYYNNIIMGVMYSMPSYNFHQLQDRMKKQGNELILINTLPLTRQDCLIKGTLKAFIEVEYMNKLLKTNKNKEIIVYGIHHTDTSVIQKYNQLKKLGFTNVHIYFGGMYEWLLLQEVFDTTNFQTDGMIKNIVDYKIE